MSDFKRGLRQYIDGLEEPVTVQEVMERRTRRDRYRVPVAVLAGAAVVLIPVLVLGLLRLLPGDDGDVADIPVATTTPTPTTIVIDEDTTTTLVDATTTQPVDNVTMPDLDGLTAEEAGPLLDDLGLTLEITERYPSRSGFGVITAQEPMAGEAISVGEIVMVGVRVEAECLGGFTVPNVPEGSMPIDVLFECAGDGQFPDVSTRVTRVVPSDDNVIEASLRALLAGLTDDERAMGFSSFFSSASADALDSVTLNDGRLIVDFNDGILINNATTSTGGMYFLAELQANLFQFSEVDEIEFRLDGSCRAFGDWQQIGECAVWTRTLWEDRLAAWEQERDTANTAEDDNAGNTSPGIAPTEVVATSSLSEEFAAANLIDGDLETTWQAQFTDALVLEFRWDEPVSIDHIEFFNISDADRFARNYRIEGYRITVDDLPAIDIRNTLADQQGGPQLIEIGSLTTRVLTLEILSYYPGAAVDGNAPFSELAVAELSFRGSPAE